MAAGMWCNKETVYLRTPAQEVHELEPVLSHIQNSVQVNAGLIAMGIAGHGQGSQMFQDA